MNRPITFETLADLRLLSHAIENAGLLPVLDAAAECDDGLDREAVGLINDARRAVVTAYMDRSWRLPQLALDTQLNAPRSLCRMVDVNGDA
jgi:hypothetical protein